MTFRSSHLPVYVDMRWPAGTGIGNVMAAISRLRPVEFEITRLDLNGSVAGPFSPINVARQLGRQSRKGVFWNPGFIPPAWSRMPTVVTVHDLTHLHYYSRAHSVYYNAVLRPLYRRCDAIVCVSEFTRNEFLEWSGMDPDRVFVVYNGVDPSFAATDGLPRSASDYVFYPGNHRAYKNLDRLVEGYARSGLAGSGVRLVMTGQENLALRQLAVALGVSDSLSFTGRVSDEEIRRLYRNARAVAFISLYEGFGLPLIEAMASGVPVMTSGVSSLPEVAGDAALIVDPTSVEEIAAGLVRVCTDDILRAELVRRGAERVRRFDWGVSANEFWKIVQSVACV